MFEPISAVEALQYDPACSAPPVCTDDGNVTAVGTAHGRTLPLVGNTRPYLFDVAVTGSTHRIYADTPTDILAILVGDSYRDYVTQLDDLHATAHIPAMSRLAAPGDVLPTELAVIADTTGLDEPDVGVDPAAHQAQVLLYDLARLRTMHADTVRVALQQQINSEARAGGRWDDLSDDERQELTVSATEGAGFPIGIPSELPILGVDDDEVPQLQTLMRATWSAPVKLVLNSGDYFPFTPAPYPVGLAATTDEHGGPATYESGEPLVEIDVQTEADYLESLAAAGVLTITERPAHQPDPVFAAMVDDPIVYPSLRRPSAAS